MVRFVLDPALEHTTGKYFQIDKKRPSSEESYNQEKARQLWNDTMQLIGMNQQ